MTNLVKNPTLQPQGDDDLGRLTAFVVRAFENLTARLNDSVGFKDPGRLAKQNLLDTIKYIDDGSEFFRRLRAMIETP